MTIPKQSYLVYPANGDAATQYQVCKAVIEPSGVLALYAIDQAGIDILVHAFNANAWRELKRMPALDFTNEPVKAV